MLHFILEANFYVAFHTSGKLWHLVSLKSSSSCLRFSEKLDILMMIMMMMTVTMMMRMMMRMMMMVMMMMMMIILEGGGGTLKDDENFFLVLNILTVDEENLHFDTNDVNDAESIILYLDITCLEFADILICI